MMWTVWMHLEADILLLCVRWPLNHNVTWNFLEMLQSAHEDHRWTRSVDAQCTRAAATPSLTNGHPELEQFPNWATLIWRQIPYFYGRRTQKSRQLKSDQDIHATYCMLFHRELLWLFVRVKLTLWNTQVLAPNERTTDNVRLALLWRRPILAGEASTFQVKTTLRLSFPSTEGILCRGKDRHFCAMVWPASLK